MVGAPPAEKLAVTLHVAPLPHKFGNEKGMAEENEEDWITCVPPQLLVMVKLPLLGKLDAFTTPFNV
jgi:hypothetical protein